MSTLPAIFEWERTFKDEIPPYTPPRKGKGYPEFDPDQPRDEGGKWTDSGGGGGDGGGGQASEGQGELFGSQTPGPKAITAGVDFAANRKALLGAIPDDVITEDNIGQVKDLEAELRDAPFIHATSPPAAEAILAGVGIESRAEVLDDIKDLRDDWANMLRQEIDVIAQGPDEEELADRLEARLEALLAKPLLDIEGYTNLTQEVLEASRAGEEMQHEARELLKPIVGTTLDADRRLGLDRYVFGTMGAPHTAYGTVFLVVDRAQLNRPGAFITTHDIIDKTIRYDVDKYKASMVAPSDWANVAAVYSVSHDVSLQPGHLNRDDIPGQPIREWEAKIPTTVPKRAIIGVVVTDPDDWERLGGNDNPLLHYLPADATMFEERFRARVTYRQRTGAWPADAPNTEPGYHSVVDREPGTR